MSCASCHAVHKKSDGPRTRREWPDDELTVAKADLKNPSDDTLANDNAPCLQCHDPLRANVSAHSHHAANSPGSVCYNCHMPYTTYGLLKTIRSHTIMNPTVRESVDAGRPNACNLCHPDALAWTGDALQCRYRI